MPTDKYNQRIHVTCTHCDAALGTPPALYVGKYTGLCKRCSDERVITLKASGRDGAKLLSYYPHAPAWRRVRDEFIAYDGCPDCNGKGFLWVSRADTRGGSYPRYCKTCFDRYYNEPLRKWASERSQRINSAAQARYTQLLRNSKCLTAARKRKCDCPPAKQALIDQANRAAWAGRERVRMIFVEMCEKRKVWWDRA